MSNENLELGICKKKLNGQLCGCQCFLVSLNNE